MFSLTAPSEDDIRHFISMHKDSSFSYAEVGSSAASLPAGYNIDHNRVELGTGEATWQRATAAIRAWRMFEMPWVSLYSPSGQPQVGIDVAVTVCHFGFYSLNACRIVYIVDEDGPVKRFGFAYGTLAEHAESGEERFTVEWDREHDTVWYDILAFSRPQKILARLAYPLSRSLQKKFARASKSAMFRAARAT
jgi:uncharacterized protein (UPF0548 family)